VVIYSPEVVAIEIPRQRRAGHSPGLVVLCCVDSKRRFGYSLAVVATLGIDS